MKTRASLLFVALSTMTVIAAEPSPNQHQPLDTTGSGKRASAPASERPASPKEYIPCDFKQELTTRASATFPAHSVVNAVIVRTGGTWRVASPRDFGRSDTHLECGTMVTGPEGSLQGRFRSAYPNVLGCPVRIPSMIPRELIAEKRGTGSGPKQYVPLVVDSGGGKLSGWLPVPCALNQPEALLAVENPNGMNSILSYGTEPSGRWKLREGAEVVPIIQKMASRQQATAETQSTWSCLANVPKRSSTRTLEEEAPKPNAGIVAPTSVFQQPTPADKTAEPDSGGYSLNF